MKKSETLPVGVVVERRAIDHPWADHRWMPVAVIPGAPAEAAWREIAHGEGWVQFHAATLPVTLHRKETEAYLVNLADSPPSVYVVLRPNDEDDEGPELTVVDATVSPYEAQDYLDSGEDIVKRVDMPEPMMAWLQAFIDAHHVDEPFRKRKRRNADMEAQQFGKVLHPIEQRFYRRKAGE